MKSWNAMEFEMIRLTSSYCMNRLLRSITAFWRLFLSLPRQQQSKKLIQKLIFTLLRLNTEASNYFIFYSTPKIGYSGCISIYCTSLFFLLLYYLVRSCAKRLSFKRSFSNNIADIGAIISISISFKPS